MKLYDGNQKLFFTICLNTNYNTSISVTSGHEPGCTSKRNNRFINNTNDNKTYVKYESITC